MRVSGLLAAALCAGAVVAVPADAACRVTKRGGGWTSIEYPTFPARDDDVIAALSTTYPYPNEGRQNVIAIGVDQWDARVLYITNGKTVLRSTDGGCTWKEAFSLWQPSSLDTSLLLGGRPDTTGTTITSIVTPAAKSAHTRVHLVIVDRPSGRVIVARSPDGAGRWTFSTLHVDDQHPGSAWMATLAIAPRHPDTMYLAVALRSYGKLYYRSTDGGATWVRRSLDDVGDYRHEGDIRLAVNPLNPAELWESDCGECSSEYFYGDFRHSTDGGATWSRPGIGNPSASYVRQLRVVVPPGAKKARVWAAYQGMFMYRSDDGGARFDRLKTADLTAGQEIMEGSNADDLVLGGRGPSLRILSGKLLRAGARNPWIDVSGRYAVKEETGGHGEDDRWMTAGPAWTATPRRVFFQPTPFTIERYEGKA